VWFGVLKGCRAAPRAAGARITRHQSDNNQESTNVRIQALRPTGYSVRSRQRQDGGEGYRIVCQVAPDELVSWSRCLGGSPTLSSGLPCDELESYCCVPESRILHTIIGLSLLPGWTSCNPWPTPVPFCTHPALPDTNPLSRQRAGAL
jgi:hypothetical protein